MKVGIITLNSAHNFGASLQTYALQKTIEKIGFDVDIINYRYKKIDNIYNPYRRFKKSYLNVKFYLSRIKLHVFDRYKIRKYNNYENFMKRYFKLTKVYKSFKDLINEKWEYDFYVCGSDQIWNPKITRGLQPAYFLSFLPKNSKKIAYAASMGTSTINENDIPIYSLYLNNLDHISVREESSAFSLSKCTEKNIESTLDPTLLLEEKDYNDIKKNANLKDNLKNEEYIFVYIIDENKELYKIAEKISKEENLPIVFSSPYLKPKKIFKNQIGRIEDAGPEEFLELISNANYVVTNSFHGNIFSIIYKKKFISAPHHITSDRVLELMKSLNLEYLIFKDSKEFESIHNIEIDYENVEKKLKDLKENSIDFLKKSLDDTNYEKKLNYLENNNDNNKFTCYGCFACKEICSSKSISMIEDYEGFFYPKINEAICNNCDICKSYCIYSKSHLIENNTFEKNSYSKKYPEVYAAYNNDQDQRLFSSSGGIFLLLAKYILSKKGYVVGVRYNSKMEPTYAIAKSEEDIKKFSGSKYVRSNISGIFPKIKELLDKNKKILFTGVPCHIAGLKSYIGEDREDLYLVEILCHSNPSPKVFKKYVQYLEEKFDSKITDFKFKNKSEGWNNPSVEIIFENGKKIVESGRHNNYNRAFQIGLMARPSCYNCEFVGKNRVGDITIGDFWGIEKLSPDLDDDKGTSLIILNNDNGKKLFNNIKNGLTVSPKKFDEAFVKNHKWPITMRRSRNEFFSKLDHERINKLLYEYT